MMLKSELLEQAGASRMLAAQGRRLSVAFTSAGDRARTEEYIKELEATALRLEREAAALG